MPQVIWATQLNWSHVDTQANNCYLRHACLLFLMVSSCLDCDANLHLKANRTEIPLEGMCQLSISIGELDTNDGHTILKKCAFIYAMPAAFYT